MFVAALRSFAEWLARTYNEAQPMLESMTASLNRGLSTARDVLAQHGPTIVAGALAIQRFSANSHVENWDSLKDEELWLKAIQLMCDDDGVSLAWTPPADVVLELVEAVDHDERDAVLLARCTEIEAHARLLLDDVTHQELATLRAATEQAWDAWAVGLPVPAQAAAGAIVGEVLLRHGFRDFGRFRIRWERFRDTRVEEWELTELRTTALMCALSTAIQREDQGTFPGFHRHLTVHGLNPEQYTAANPLRGLMLVTAAVRELQFQLAEEWRTSSGFALPRQAIQTPAQIASVGPVMRTRLDVVLPPGGVRWAALHARPRVSIATLRREDVPAEFGVYALYRHSSPQYVGVAERQTLRARVWGNHLGRGTSMSGSAMRRNIAEMLGIASSAAIKNKTYITTAEDARRVRAWQDDCEIAWITCDDSAAAIALEGALKAEHLPPLTKR